MKELNRDQLKELGVIMKEAGNLPNPEITDFVLVFNQLKRLAESLKELSISSNELFLLVSEKRRLYSYFDERNNTRKLLEFISAKYPVYVTPPNTVQLTIQNPTDSEILPIVISQLAIQSDLIEGFTSLFEAGKPYRETKGFYETLKKCLGKSRRMIERFYFLRTQKEAA